MPQPDALDPSSLRALFDPASVAVIGASSDGTRIGGRPLRGSLQWHFAGGLFPVNPGRTEIQGLACYPSIEAIGRPVDLALIALPAAQAHDALEQCVRAGVKSVIVLSAGFAELAGGADVAAQDALAHAARAAGIRMMGPNCMGLINARTGLVASFTSMIGDGSAHIGGISLVSQSGAFGSHCLAIMRERGLGLNLWATTGNQADVDFSDCLAYMATDPHTRVVVGCLEGLSDGRRLVAALALARRRGVPVVIMKLGRSEIGRAAALTHTAAMAGSDAVFDAVLAEYGACRARDVDELFDIGYACTQGKFPLAATVGLISTSGGFGVMMADACAEHGLDVPALPAATQTALKALVPLGSMRNPLDITGQVVNDPRAMLPVFTRLIEDGGFPASICYIGAAGRMPKLLDGLTPAFREIAQRFPAHLLVLSMVAAAESIRHFEELGYLVFENPTRAVTAVAALHRFAQSFAAATVDAVDAADAADAADPAVPMETTTAADTTPMVRAAGSSTAPVGGPVNGQAASALDEAQSKAILARAGVPVPGECVATSSAEARAAAARIGFPVAMKILSADIAHKSDIGGVALGIGSEAEAAAAFEHIEAAVARAAPHARIGGVLVAPMIDDGVEMIAGIRNDPLFGAVVMIGFGGVLVEVLDATALRLAPFGVETARAMIASLRGARILSGVRGRPSADVEALAATLSSLSRFAAANAGWIESVDINPLVVRPAGKGVVALDALVVTRGQYSPQDSTCAGGASLVPRARCCFRAPSITAS